MKALVRPMERCGALRSNGQLCRKWAMKGGHRCMKHGGRAPQVMAAAERRFAARQMNAEITEMGTAVQTSAPEALQGLLNETAGMVVAAREKVQGLDGLTPAQASAVLDRYDAERDRLQRFAKDHATLGIAERQQALREGEIDQLYQAMIGSLAVLPIEQRAAVEGELKRRLTGLVAIEATAT